MVCVPKIAEKKKKFICSFTLSSSDSSVHLSRCFLFHGNLQQRHLSRQQWGTGHQHCFVWGNKSPELSFPKLVWMWQWGTGQPHYSEHCKKMFMWEWGTSQPHCCANYGYDFFSLQLHCPIGTSPMGNSGCFPWAKPAATELRYPTCGACWVF